MRGYIIKDGAAYRAQMLHACRVSRIHHHKLITAGFGWDGMDGYVAPEGFTAEQAHELWKQSNEEAMRHD